MQQPRPQPRDTGFADWMSRRRPALLRTAYLISGDLHTAEDLVQTALAKVYLAWDRIEDHDRLDGYAYKALVNEHNSLWRRAWKRRELVSDQLPERGYHDDPDDGSHDALWRCVATLPRRQRAVLVLRYYEQLSEAETAEVLGISVGTVKSQCSRALARLRERQDEHPDLSPREQER